MEDTASFKEMLRMDYDTFLNLLANIEPFISIFCWIFSQPS